MWGIASFFCLDLGLYPVDPYLYRCYPCLYRGLFDLLILIYVDGHDHDHDRALYLCHDLDLCLDLGRDRDDLSPDGPVIESGNENDACSSCKETKPIKCTNKLF